MNSRFFSAIIIIVNGFLMSNTIFRSSNGNGTNDEKSVDKSKHTYIHAGDMCSWESSKT